MALTATEKAKVRKHLGYPNVSRAAGFGQGIPTVFDLRFPLDGALDALTPEGEVLVRELLTRCDQSETCLFEATTTIGVTRVGEIALSEKETDLRRRAYLYWIRRLADAFACEPNPYSEHATRGMNIRRAH